MTRRSFPAPLLLALVLLAAAAFRICDLTGVPPGLQHDEVFHAHDAFTVRMGHPALWFPSNAGNEPLYITLMAISTGLVGDNALGIRLTSVGCGLLAIALTTRFTALAFGRRAALLAAAFMAVTFWPVWLSRAGLRAASLPPLAGLAAWLTVRALRRGQIRAYALAGLAAGLALYTYAAGLAVPLGLLVFTLGLALWRREALAGAARGQLALWLAAAITAAPLAAAVAAAGGYLRVQQTALPIAALRAGDPGPLLNGLTRTLGLWFAAGDPLWRYNVAGRPVFGPALAVFFVAGVAAALVMAARPGQRGLAGLLLIALLLAGVLPSALTDSPPAFLRASAALPATFAALGLGLERARAILEARLPASRRWLPALIAALLALTAAFTARDYFGVWARHPEVQRAYRADLAAAAAYLQAHPPPGGRAALSTSEPNHLDPFIFDYTPHGAADIAWFDGLNAIAVPAGSGPAWIFITAEPIPQARLQRDYLDRLPRLSEGRLPGGGAAFTLYEAPAGEAFFAAFPPPTDQGVWVSEALAFPPDDPGGVRTPLALPVRFGDALELVGYESPRRNPAGTWLPLALHFRVLRDVAAPEPWALFAHVLDAQGNLAAGRDFLAVPASTWRRGDVFVQLHDVALPDLPPGLYHVEIGLYSQADGTRFPVTDGTASGDRLLLEPVAITPP